MQKLLKWFKDMEFGLLHVVLLAYVFLIPIWPKLPLMRIEYTYVAIRYEDVFIALTVLVFLFELLRRKVTLKGNPLLFAIPLFWVIVFVSAMVGLFVLDTVINLDLAVLNSARRVEYMIIFFIAFAAIKNTRQADFFLKSMLVVLFLVSTYGIGQKFLGWPAIQTMNPHYAKGYLLTLDANARISSTFGGHYDFAAYLVLLMPLAVGMYLATERTRYFLIFVVALVSLILTASRVSFVAYLVSIPAFLLFFRKFKLIMVVVVLTLILLPLSENLTKRINRTFRQELVWVNEEGSAIVPREITADDLPPGDFVIQDKGGEVNTEGNRKQVDLVKKELRKQLVEDANKKGQKLTDEELERMVNEAFSKFTPVSSVLPDISFATRLQVEWPRAIGAFLKNPLLGTGPSSITEATDNDYLRALGEVGLLGFAAFFYIIGKIIFLLFLKAKELSGKARYIYWAVLFGIWALLVNALYIDVFEASKVAFVLWFLAGLMIKTTYLPAKKIDKQFGGK